MHPRQLPVSAEQPTAVVGFLSSGSVAALNKQWISAFHRGLRDFGYIDGQNVSIDYRAADDNYDLLIAEVNLIRCAGTKDDPCQFRSTRDSVAEFGRLTARTETTPRRTQSGGDHAVWADRIG
jgi:hypothetical protein